ncbi:bifunctional DNA primase/polymerase [Saccharothrix sp. AJ9571]|nr:bifunctional DNA primase/polymerase [Saccharothrix sp. AJ9571]
MNTSPHLPVLPPTTSSALLDAALEAADRGWAVFPLAPRTKRPAIARWERQATRDPARIRRWWRRHPEDNIGVACGPSRLLVLDLDAAHGRVPPRWAARGVSHGRDVIALLAARAHQPDPVDTLIVATPRDGEHRFFRLRPGTEVRSTVGERGRGLGWHADTRGPGSLIAAPGSVGLVHGQPVPYRIVRDAPIAILPDWLITRLTPPPPPPRPAPGPELPATSRRVTAYVRAALDAETLKVAVAEEGQRHITLYAAAAALGELLANDWISHSAITSHLTEAARHHVGVAEFTWQELTTTIRDGIAAGRRTRRILPDRPQEAHRAR